MLPATVDEIFRRERAFVLATTIRVANGDFDLAEEAVQEAFAVAIERWPVEDLPDEPRAWLVNVARNKAIDTIRRRVKGRQIASELTPASEPAAASVAPFTVTDDRLRLIFTCCHPALAPEAQVALTLRTLCGLSTEEIARAFLVEPATMAQRLVRAKGKIKGAKIPYVVPEASELPERLASVMETIYLVFNEGYAATAGDDWIRRDLCKEAIRLASLLADLVSEPEVRGLLALMLLHDSRRDARVDAAGDIVLLEDQDRSRWDKDEIGMGIAIGERAMRDAFEAGGPERVGPYTIQAGIAMAHANAPRPEDTRWDHIAHLYRMLYARVPTAVVALNHAAAVAMVVGPERALVLMADLAGELADYHLFHAARADLLRRLDRRAEAADAYRAALACVGSEPERRFLERRLAEVTAPLA
jgi:RNA polymerase sigma-70 factor (ECF subfamily)